MSDPSAVQKPKVVLVTGSSAGIGEGIARRLGAEGWQVAVHGFEPAEVERVSSEIPGSVGFPGDLAEPDVPARLIEQTLEAFGRIDALVNNAGWSGRSNLEDTTDEFFERIFAINARAPRKLIQACLPLFKAQGRGSVVNIGSICAYGGPPHLLDYSMSKAALMGMTQNLAAAHAKDGLRINQLNIGWTLTPNEYQIGLQDGMEEGWPVRMPEYLIPYGRMLAPGDIAGAVSYLLSDGAQMLNGSVILFSCLPTSSPT